MGILSKLYTYLAESETSSRLHNMYNYLIFNYSHNSHTFIGTLIDTRSVLRKRLTGKISRGRYISGKYRRAFREIQEKAASPDNPWKPPKYKQFFMGGHPYLKP